MKVNIDIYELFNLQSFINYNTQRWIKITQLLERYFGFELYMYVYIHTYTAFKYSARMSIFTHYFCGPIDTMKYFLSDFNVVIQKITSKITFGPVDIKWNSNWNAYYWATFFIPHPS